MAFLGSKHKYLQEKITIHNFKQRPAVSKEKIFTSLIKK